jgi:oxygen-dependent protoporphyrinogen oxidase
MKRIIVVGGGITGLAAAYRLKTQAPKHAAFEIVLLEASSRLGGTLKTTTRDGFLLESGPDCFLSEKLPALELCRELGLVDQLLSTRTEHRRSFIVKGGKLYPVPQGFYLIAPSRLRPFLSSSLLPWSGKWRVLLESLIPAHAQSDESLASFVRRRLGQSTLDWLAQPLLAGIYAADPETLSLQATFPQFLEMEKKYGSVLVGLKKRDAATKEASGARYSLFTTFRSGMQTLTDQLEKQLSGVQIRRSVRVQSIKRSSEGWQLDLSQGGPIAGEGICLALPAYRSAELLRRELPALADQLNTIPFSGSATLNLAFKESAIPQALDGFGFVTPFAEKRTTLACTFVHRKFTGRAPAGHALLRAFVGGALQEELLQLDDAELQKRVLTDLRELLGITQAPLFAALERWPSGMPQYTLGHLKRVLQIEESLLTYPGLTLAGNWLKGVGVPDCIESGQRAADILLARIPGLQLA